MLRVFTAMGKQMPKDKAMIEDVQRVAQLLAKYNCTTVQGGAKTGLMGVVVQEFQKYSDEVVMIVPEVHKSDLIGTKNKEFYIVEGESDRMRITIHSCDMMIVFPGGSGTLAELAYYNETRKSGEHKARVVVVNTHGFFNKLFKFHKHQIKCGFMKPEHSTFDVVKNADELEKIIQEVIAEKQERLRKESLAKDAAKKASSGKKRGRPASKKTAAKKETSKKAAPSKTKKVVKEDVEVANQIETVEVAKQSTAKKVPTKKPATKKTATGKTSAKKKLATKTSAKKDSK